MKTDITIVLDRSGSMHEIQSQTVEGLNQFIAEQKSREGSGDAFLTLVQFDHTYDFVYKAVPVKELPDFTDLVPRGSTALLDAFGRAIRETEERIKGKEEEINVIFVVITDGKENSSQEWTRDRILKLVTEKTEEKWAFLYLGANQDAIREAYAYGISADCAADYGTSREETGAAYGACAQHVGLMRDAEVKTCGGLKFSDTQRRSMSKSFDQKGGDAET